MAKFLNTTGVSYHLEELIKGTKDRLILISPYLQLGDRIKEHLSNLNIQKRDIRIVYREIWSIGTKFLVTFSFSSIRINSRQ